MKRLCLYMIALLILASVFAVAQKSANEGSGSASDAPKTSSDRPVRVRVSQGVSNGLLISKVQPIYPEDARKAGIQGRVILKAEIDKDGNVEDLATISGDSALAPAAIEAVKQWKYKPYLLKGEPIGVETEVIVNFTLVKN
jgi:periplasmic protein TonB